MKPWGLTVLCLSLTAMALYLSGLSTESTAEQLSFKLSGPFPERAVRWQPVKVPFDLQGYSGNPFDPRDVNVVLKLELPDQTVVEHPAFFTRDHRVLIEHGRELVRDQDQSHWEIRWTPRQPGVHQWTLVAEADGNTTTLSGRIDVADSQQGGFVQISQTDSQWFETSDGRFFYPVGHGTRSPEDARWNPLDGETRSEEPDHGPRFRTQRYAEWFAQMKAHGENCCSIWMSPWWLGLEWSPELPGYSGLGQYNQIHCAQLDRILELAETHEIKVMLYTMNHGQLSTVIDREWFSNPYRRNGDQGLVDTPGEFFESDACRRLHKNKLRYLLARWGYSTALMGIVLCTEVEWVDPYHGCEADQSANVIDAVAQPHQLIPRDLDLVRDWLQSMSRYTSGQDVHGHPVTVQFATLGNGNEVWNDPEFTIVMNNAYSNQLVTAEVTQQLDSKADGHLDGLLGWTKHFRELTTDKPIMVAEWGGHHMHNSSPVLEASLHSGIWSMAMTDLSGVTGFWWWNEIHDHGLYRHFRPVVDFFGDYDRRQKGLVSQSARVQLLIERTQDNHTRAVYLPHPSRKGLMLYNSTELFAYFAHHNLHSTNVPVTDNEDLLYPQAHSTYLELPVELAEGRYRIEFWDTFSGSIVESSTVDLASPQKGTRHLKLFPFRADIAMKLFAIDGNHRNTVALKEICADPAIMASETDRVATSYASTAPAQN